MLILGDFEKGKWLFGRFSWAAPRESWNCSLTCRGRAFLLLISISCPEEASESIPKSTDRQHGLLTLLGSVSAFFTKEHMERAREVLCEMLSGQVQD